VKAALDSKDLSGLRVLSIDLDDTLWPIMPVIEMANQVSWDWFGEHYPGVVERFTLADCYHFRAQASRMHPHRSHDLSRMRIVTYELLLQAAGYDKEAANAAFEVFFTARNEVQPFPEVESALQRLAGQFQLISLTNGNADLEQIALGQYFSASVSACSAGIKKPDPAIFDAACKVAGVNRSQILHIGDHPLQDVVGAIDFGMASIWVNRQGLAWRHPQQPWMIASDLGQVADRLLW